MQFISITYYNPSNNLFVSFKLDSIPISRKFRKKPVNLFTNVQMDHLITRVNFIV